MTSEPNRTIIRVQQRTERNRGGEKVKINKVKYELACARACVGSKELEKAGLSRNVLFGISDPKRELRPSTVGKIAKALGCDVTEIIETEEN